MLYDLISVNLNEETPDSRFTLFILSLTIEIFSSDASRHWDKFDKFSQPIMSRDRAQDYVFIGPVTVHNSIDEADNTEEETANGGQETN